MIVAAIGCLNNYLGFNERRKPELGKLVASKKNSGEKKIASKGTSKEWNTSCIAVQETRKIFSVF